MSLVIFTAKRSAMLRPIIVLLFLLFVNSSNVSSQNYPTWIIPKKVIDTTGQAELNRDIEEIYQFFKEYVADPKGYFLYKGNKYFYFNLDPLIDTLINHYYANGVFQDGDKNQFISLNKKFSTPIQDLIQRYYFSTSIIKKTVLKDSIENALSNLYVSVERIYLEILFFKVLIKEIKNPYEYTSYVQSFFYYLKSTLQNENYENYLYNLNQLQVSEEKSVISSIAFLGDDFYTVCKMCANLFSELIQNDMATYFLIQAAMYYGQDSSSKYNYDIFYTLAGNLHNTVDKTLEEKAYSYYSTAMAYASKANQEQNVFQAHNASIYLYFNYITRFQGSQYDIQSFHDIPVNLYTWIVEDSLNKYKSDSYMVFLNIAMFAQNRGDYITAKRYFNLAFIYRTLYSGRNDRTFNFDLSNLIQINDHTKDTNNVKRYFSFAENYWKSLTTVQRIQAAINYAGRYTEQKKKDNAIEIITSIENRLLRTDLTIGEFTNIDKKITEVKKTIYEELNSPDSSYRYKRMSDLHQSMTDVQINNIYAYEKEFDLTRIAVPLIRNIENNKEELWQLSNDIAETKNEIAKMNVANASLKNSNKALADSIKKKNTLLNELTIGIASKNKQMEDLAKKIKVDSAQLKQSEIANITLKKDNDTLKESSEILTISLYILSPIALGLFVTSLVFGRNIRKKRKQLRELDIRIIDLKMEAEEKDLGKKLAQQQLLNDTALGHDLVELVGHIPLFIKQFGRSLPADVRNTKEYNKCLLIAERTEEYFRSNFKQKESLNTTVKEDIALAKQYVELLQFVDDDFPTTLHIDEFDQEISEIEIPKHNLVNFVSNAYKHARKNIQNKSVSIAAKAEKVKEGYTIVITDTGGGFDTLGLECKPDTRGLKLVLRQVENFNSIEANPYAINFMEQDIENIYEGSIRCGTKITYTINKR